MYSTLITPEQLKDHLDDPSWAVMDCRFSLQDPHYGRKHYLEAHIPSAVYVHLDEDLSGPVIPGVTGRHPLPSPQQAARTFSNLGIGPDVQVVAYDDAGGALAAVRLWWMLHWLGHSQAAVLDGGWQRWQKEGLPVRSGSEQRPHSEFQIDLHPEKLVDVSEVDHMRQSPASLSSTPARKTAIAVKMKSSIPSPGTYPAQSASLTWTT
jgi:thiosulfate/3-mercaptopyruvate sulfurtransferase